MIMDLVNAPKWHQYLAIAFIAYVVVGILGALFGIGGGSLITLFSLAFIPLMYLLAKAIGKNPVLWAVLGIPLVCFFAVPVLLTKSMNLAKANGASANLISIRVA
jgi:hypothetical protein